MTEADTSPVEGGAVSDPLLALPGGLCRPAECGSRSVTTWGDKTRCPFKLTHGRQVLLCCALATKCFSIFRLFCGGRRRFGIQSRSSGACIYFPASHSPQTSTGQASVLPPSLPRPPARPPRVFSLFLEKVAQLPFPQESSGVVYSSSLQEPHKVKK